MSSPEVRLIPDGAAISPAGSASTIETGHTVQFYENESFLAAAVSDYLVEGVNKGQKLIIIARPANRDAFALRMRSRGVDVEGLRRAGDLVMLDAQDTLNMFMSGDRPDRERFRATIGAVIERCRQHDGLVGVRAYGEMVDILWRAGNTDAAIRLEGLWNELAEHYPFSLLCAYAMGNFYKTSDAEAFQAICHSHTHVIPTERYVEADSDLRALDYSRLQQRELALETEIAQRKELEMRLRDALRSVQETEETIRASEAELKDFLENATEGMHWVGPDGRILWANRAELQLLGYTADEYIGHDIAEFHADRDVIRDILARLKGKTDLHEFEARLRCKDGSIRHVLINSNVLWRDGDFVHTRCFTRDVTQLKTAAMERERLLESERAARADADKANRAKSEFLAAMSHELRTPLNSIAGHVDLLQLGVYGALNEQQQTALSRVERSGKLLLALINDVLNLSRIEAGRIEYNLETIVLYPLLRDACETIVPQVSAKRLHCEVQDPGTGIAVRADRERVQQIVLNLLTNAIKFTPEDGSITISIAQAPDPANVVCVQVSDTGIGIPSAKLATIFEPFVQAGAQTGVQQGVGLGLAISRDLAVGMGGALSVSSEIGKGATFTLCLPRATA